VKVHPQARDLLAEIRAYCARTGMTRTRFGVEALNDGHLLARLQSGREPRWATIARVRKFMRNGKKRA
jgi:hypothetical protein